MRTFSPHPLQTFAILVPTHYTFPTPSPHSLQTPNSFKSPSLLQHLTPQTFPSLPLISPFHPSPLPFTPLIPSPLTPHRSDPPSLLALLLSILTPSTPAHDHSPLTTPITPGSQLSHPPPNPSPHIHPYPHALPR